MKTSNKTESISIKDSLVKLGLLQVANNVFVLPKSTKGTNKP